ncbi:hypothetical protein PANDA_014791, partial [Ailuropoda melanoleuca]
GGDSPKETAENQALGKLPEFWFSAHPGFRSLMRPPREPGSLTSRWHPLQRFFSWTGAGRPSSSAPPPSPRPSVPSPVSFEP